MKLIKGLFLLFSLCMFALAAASFASTLDRQKEPEKPSLTAVSDGNSYILRREGDGVAVFGTAGEYVGTLDVCFADLPAQDQQLLESGVMVESESQLLAMIEDYTS